MTPIGPVVSRIGNTPGVTAAGGFIAGVVLTILWHLWYSSRLIKWERAVIDTSVAPTDVRNAVLAGINTHLVFHNSWRNRMMTCSTMLSILVIVCSGGATLVSAWNGDSISALLAFVASISVGLDNRLRFREKWKLHLALVMALEQIKVSFTAGKLDCDSAATQLSDVIKSYADRLPFSERE